MTSASFAVRRSMTVCVNVCSIGDDTRVPVRMSAAAASAFAVHDDDDDGDER